MLIRSLKSLTALAALVLVGLPAVNAAAIPGANIDAVPEAKRIDAVLRQPEIEIDFARVKLTFDKEIDPSIDVKANLRRIDDIVARIRGLLQPNPSSNEKVAALKKYLYEKGPWNDNRAYSYDFDDPLGKNIQNKLLPNYLSSRKGNCVSMPFLFVILGQRLGIDATVATAPHHFLVKYTDPDSKTTYNLEATSGANPTRDSWYRQQMPMTDEALANGVYLKKLTKRETAAVMATVIAEHFLQRQEHEKVIAISDVVLTYYPKGVASMLSKGSAFGRLAKKHYGGMYQTPANMPAEEQSHLQYLSEQNRIWFAKAESLGWREPDAASEAKYLKTFGQSK